jgi:hypothetical protein
LGAGEVFDLLHFAPFAAFEAFPVTSGGGATRLSPTNLGAVSLGLAAGGGGIGAASADGTGGTKRGPFGQGIRINND